MLIMTSSAVASVSMIVPATSMDRNTSVTRRLAAVAFADVANWSRMIEKNDVETLRSWKALRSELLEPKIQEVMDGEEDLNFDLFKSFAQDWFDVLQKARRENKGIVVLVWV